MSKYEELVTNITDEPHLVAALKDMGYTAEVCKEPTTLIGYHGDERPEKAHIIVRRSQIGSVANDIGFFKNSDGKYQAIISQYDQHRHGAKWMGRLTQSYAEHRAMSIARAKGYTFQGRTVVDGKVQLKFGVR